MDPEELAAKEAADKAAADEAAAKAKKEAEDKAALELADKDKNKPSDAEAALLKDLMKQKAAAKAAKDAADAAEAKLKAFDGIDPTKIRELVAAQEKAELEAAEKRGEYDRILAQVREQSERELKARDEAAAALQKQLEAAQSRIDALTVGTSFGNSKFLTEETILTPLKARKLYEDHFDLVEGELVGFDKPRGSKDRTPLVDARGDNLGFESAIEKIVKSDPDFERIARSKLKSGSSSNPSDDLKVGDKEKPTEAGVTRLEAALKARAKK